MRRRTAGVDADDADDQPDERHLRLPFTVLCRVKVEADLKKEEQVATSVVRRNQKLLSSASREPPRAGGSRRPLLGALYSGSQKGSWTAAILRITTRRQQLSEREEVSVGSGCKRIIPFPHAMQKNHYIRLLLLLRTRPILSPIGSPDASLKRRQDGGGRGCVDAKRVRGEMQGW